MNKTALTLVSLWVSLSTSLLVLSTGCGSASSDSTDNEEIGQQVGDTMASVDEAGGSSTGSLALGELKGFNATLARLTPFEFKKLQEPTAYAASCATATTFGSCTNNVITRTFGSCTIGTTTLAGTIGLTWSDASVDNTCAMTASGHSITRNPNFTITGRRGATLTVSKTGTNGQVLTRSATAGTFSFTNDGIRRVFTTSGNETSFDFTTTTTSAITITGASRASRTLSGGTLRVKNNTSGTSCDFVPTAVSWGATCNCPTSGTWSGTCSDETTSTLTLTGCGTGTLVVGQTTQTITFDRCYGI